MARPKKRRSMVPLNILIPPELREAIQAEAHRMKTSTGFVVRAALFARYADKVTLNKNFGPMAGRGKT